MGRRAQSAKTPLAVVREFVDRVNRRDLAGVVGLLSEEHTFFVEGERPTVGRTAMEKAWREYLTGFPTYRIVEDEAYASGKDVFIVGHTRGSHVPPELEAVPSCVIWKARVEGERISAWVIHPATVENRRRFALPVVAVKPVASLSDDERAALKALTTAVYPPAVVAASPGRHLRWAPPEYSVLVSTPAGDLVSHVGIVIRAATLDGVPVTIGGIGSVKTHPRVEGRGYASTALRRAASALIDDHQVGFALLVCQEHLLPFYNRLGWLAFSGRLVVEQPTGPTVLTINRPMVLTGRRPAPPDGTIDLNGLPW